jgi:lipoate-protein ligase B
VNPDLKPFEWIRPCGLEGIGVTSIQAESAEPVGIADAKAVMQAQLEAVFQTRLLPVDRRELFMAADPSSSEADIFPVEAAFQPR